MIGIVVDMGEGMIGGAGAPPVITKNEGATKEGAGAGAPLADTTIGVAATTIVVVGVATMIGVRSFFVWSEITAVLLPLANRDARNEKFLGVLGCCHGSTSQEVILLLPCGTRASVMFYAGPFVMCSRWGVSSPSLILGHLFCSRVLD
mmetsp:Transcript_10059/g.20109  ORF Transcript_10059/g.20109 Transcript_10059/m.20109 type:complete len:148 (+) Transcript_10059:855-1298(+)